MKSLKSLASAARTLSATEMVKTKGGTGYEITTQIDIVCIGVTGSVETLYCDRRRKRVGSTGI
jgi:hypothetical protein